MGQWHISIEGTGIHHNKTWKDANALAARFVKYLRDNGHIVTKASFVYGANQDLLNEENNKFWEDPNWDTALK